MFKPSELFNLEKPELWKEWKQRLQGTGNLQINSLLYSLGSEAEKVFVQLTFAEGEADQYDKVLEKLEDNFTPKVNINLYTNAQFFIGVIKARMKTWHAMCVRCMTRQSGHSDSSHLLSR